MDRELLIRKNNLEVNKLAAKCLRITVLFLISLWLFTLSDYYSFDKYTITIIFISCLLLLLIPSVLVNVIHLERHWVKYYVIMCTLAVVFLLSLFVSYDFIILLILTLLIATLYCDRKLIVITTLVDCLCVLGTLLLRYYFIESDELLKEYDSLTSALIYGGFLRIVLLLVATLFSYYIVDRNMVMLNKTIEANNDLVHSQEELIYAFAEISESKSKVTGEHIRRVSEYMKILGNASGFTTDYVDKLAVAAMMHDIGKLMIPEEILDKPDRLTEEEYAIMKNHVLYGEALLAKCPGDIMQIAKTIALEHHEKWDGSGYLGMKGEDISYISRLMAVCDVFDALTSQRYYKDGWSLEETYNEIVRLKGVHFDPDVVDLFVENFDEFKEILHKLPDREIY
ncbi:MAG: HD-GYP domain-containing protein [Lachnospiraceae bacterium]|nr:HD-GYP domain-containing protein [Lachnospiraceae bacterium]MDE6626113.1 HD-GYP domain-containing protein [Lachnospiraceae bacterium]